MKPFRGHVAEMQSLAKLLARYTRHADDEADLAVLKTREICVDGHWLVVYYSVEERSEFVLHTVRVSSRDVAFVPFWLHCRLVAVAFLGDRELALSEFLFLGKKLYVWSQGRDLDSGEPVKVLLHPKAMHVEYDGVAFQRAPTARILVPNVPG